MKRHWNDDGIEDQNQYSPQKRYHCNSDSIDKIENKEQSAISDAREMPVKEFSNSELSSKITYDNIEETNSSYTDNSSIMFSSKKRFCNYADILIDDLIRKEAKKTHESCSLYLENYSRNGENNGWLGSEDLTRASIPSSPSYYDSNNWALVPVTNTSIDQVVGDSDDMIIDPDSPGSLSP